MDHEFHYIILANSNEFYLKLCESPIVESLKLEYASVEDGIADRRPI